jgi:CubicO group peptidase (beta-lactamase class C family)
MRRRVFLAGGATVLAAGFSGRALAAPQKQGAPNPQKLPVFSLPNTPDLYRIIFQNAVKKHKFDTAILVIRRDGRTVTKLGHNTDADGPSLIGSMSKPITAVAIATLIQNGKLKFTTPMKEALADYFQQHGPPRDRRFEKVTVEQLLVHRSGMRGNPDGDPFHAAVADRAANGKGNLDVPQEILGILLKSPLVRDPGGQASYSNGGYVALASAIERASGTAYERYCRALVFDRLDLQAVLHPQWRVLGAPGGWFINGESYLRFLDVISPESRFLSNETKLWIDSAQTKWGPLDQWRSLAVLTSRNTGPWKVEHSGGLNSTGKDASGKAITAAIESWGGRRADGISVFAAITPNVTNGHPGFKELKADIEKAHAQVTKF